MDNFNKDKIAEYLGVVRKYMQVRGALSQKELAELTGVGVSTMSRFLAQKTSDLNPQLIAKITAKLNIPLHEIIDFVEEDYSDHFIRLVKFYKEEGGLADVGPSDPVPASEASGPVSTNATEGSFEETFSDALGAGSAKKNVTAKIKVGGRTQNIPFETEGGRELTIKEKLEQLSPRQRAYMSDFLNLDMEGRDLIVDLGNDLFRFFRQKGMTI
ncbi:helix-turn-helix domain-containing protein [Halobacteriovorax sp. HLS]|uniref:helix-turn-helix domain-containing protein n=1 Tax=Halobacteriovorax sp. HLS TaxID=2234000 RepID=UPI000FDB2342|nr:helix-turn-helix transcriptional regulator [Halobacteriovorax sp. HLS]